MALTNEFSILFPKDLYVKAKGDDLIESGMTVIGEKP